MSGMIIDGVAASEAIDSSGEILSVEGCDISDLEKGVGVLNYEHRGDDANGASSNDVVGKIIYCRKIFKKEDAEDERQKSYWDKVKLPFIYIKARLFDGDPRHQGARSAAAIIRDAYDHKEPIVARFSIEGSTLKKDGNKLLKSIARKIALTLKPCNKSAISGLISDPNGATPMDVEGKKPDILTGLLEGTMKFERPGEQHLGSVENDINPFVSEDVSSTLKRSALLLKTEIDKLLKNTIPPAKKPVYLGWFLSPQAREQLLQRFPAIHPNVHADHVTFQFGPKDEHIGKFASVLGQMQNARVVSHHQDEKGQAVGVEVPDPMGGDPARLHITLSTADGVKPVYSNELLKRGLGQKVEPLELEGSYDHFPRAGLVKATAAGQGGAAPSSTIPFGHQLLSKEKLEELSNTAKNKLKAILRDSQGLNKEEFKQFVKAHMPEATDSFLEYFDRLREDVEAKKSKLALMESYLQLEAKRVEHLSKGEESSIEEPKTPKKSIRFQGETILPGVIHILKDKMGMNLKQPKPLAFIAAPSEKTDWHFIAMPEDKVNDYTEQDLLRLSSNQQEHAFKLVRPPINISRQFIVNPEVHGNKRLHPDKEQSKLLQGLYFGLDISASDPENYHAGVAETRFIPYVDKALLERGELKGDYKHSVLAKKNIDRSPTALYDATTAEVLAHNLLKHFFDLGKHVKTTATFKDPVKGESYVAVEKILGANHYTETDRQKDLLRKLLEDGTLDKMFMADSIIQNADRHNGNFMFDGKDGMFLIDHNFAFEGTHGLARGRNGHVPTYMRHALDHWSEEKKWDVISHPVHPDAVKWALDLNPTKLTALFDEYFDEDDPKAMLVKKVALERLQDIQDHLHNFDDPRSYEMYCIPSMMEGSAAGFQAPFMEKIRDVHFIPVRIRRTAAEASAEKGTHAHIEQKLLKAKKRFIRMTEHLDKSRARGDVYGIRFYADQVEDAQKEIANWVAEAKHALGKEK